MAAAALLWASAARPAWSQDAIDDLDDLKASSVGSAQSSAGWRGALNDSFRLLMMEHAGRIAFQEKTRRELGGPFFKDYARSVKWPHKWEDGDAWGVNYIGHPIHGAAASRIWLDHTDHDPRFDNTAAYWASRGMAAAWAAGYSMQFEFGPLSEASIGNVGLDPATTGWVDHVITPAGAFAFTVGEDVLDRYFISLVERHTQNRLVRAVVRILFNPSRSLANVTEGRSPWFRPDRPLR
jgi:hypothetical protein